MPDSENLYQLEIQRRDNPVITLSIRRYDDGPLWGKRYLGLGRWALDAGVISFIVECWWIRA